MIFCVFLDPETIRRSAAQGDLGADHLIGVLRALLENCLLAETTDWQVGGELKDAVKAIEEPNLRMRAVALLEKFATRNRFADFLEPIESNADALPAAVALANRDHPSLDAILTESPEPHSPGRTEVIPIGRFNGSNFAANRSQSTRGRTLPQGEMQATEFFEVFFSKLRLVSLPKWEVCDYAIGDTGFGENYFHNLRWWIEFLAQSEEPIEFVLHTQGHLRQNIQNRLDELCEGTSVRARVKIHESLPHERYLITSAFVFNIGRGIDLIDPHSQRNRDIHLSLSPPLAQTFD
jgi:hypothetical protein